VTDDGAPHRDALALAAGELPWTAIEQRGDPQDLRGRAHQAIDLRLRDVPHLEAEGEVGPHAHVRVERVVLEHHGDVAIRGSDVVDHAVADGDPAAGDLLQAGHHPQRGGLATARRADQDHELAVADLEIELLTVVRPGL
jgi:hypothetical protein